MLDVIGTILGVIIAVILSAFFLYVLAYIIFHEMAYGIAEDHYQKVKEEGLDFLDSLQQEGLTPMKFAKLEEEEKQEHYVFYDIDEVKVKEFMVLAVAMPNFPTINARVVDLWWPGYKITRQALRRFPKPQ